MVGNVGCGRERRRKGSFLLKYGDQEREREGREGRNISKERNSAEEEGIVASSGGRNFWPGVGSTVCCHVAVYTYRESVHAFGFINGDIKAATPHNNNRQRQLSLSL